MAFTVIYENNELPKDCFKCPMSSFVSSDCLYCPPQGVYVHPQKDERPESCTIRRHEMSDERFKQMNERRMNARNNN